MSRGLGTTPALRATPPHCKAHAKKAGKFDPSKTQRYRCLHCKKSFSDAGPLDDMRIPVEKATQILNLLVEGVGINAASRIASVNKRTVFSVLALVGERCEKLMDEKLRNLPLVDIQCDEIRTFVGKKEARVTASDNAALVGDQYTFVSIDRDSKLVINYAVGKRTAPVTQHFTVDLADRLTDRPQISTDSFGAYKLAIRKAFDGHVDDGQVVKIYEKGVHGAHREGPPKVEKTIRTTMTGEPRKDEICTSHVERSILSMRTFMQRLARLCLGFSKKVENLKYAVALYFAWYNFVPVHSTLKTTPVVAAGITGMTWTLAELLRAA